MGTVFLFFAVEDIIAGKRVDVHEKGHVVHELQLARGYFGEGDVKSIEHDQIPTVVRRAWPDLP